MGCCIGRDWGIRGRGTQGEKAGGGVESHALGVRLAGAESEGMRSVRQWQKFSGSVVDCLSCWIRNIPKIR